MRRGSTTLRWSGKKLPSSGERPVNPVQKKRKLDLRGKPWHLSFGMQNRFSWYGTCPKALQSQLCNIKGPFVIFEPPFTERCWNCVMKMCCSFMTVLVNIQQMQRPWHYSRSSGDRFFRVRHICRTLHPMIASCSWSRKPILLDRTFAPIKKRKQRSTDLFVTVRKRLFFLWESNISFSNLINC